MSGEAIAERVSMGKAKGRPKSDRDDVTIRVSRPMASKLKMIAGEKGLTVGEVADGLFGATLNRAYLQVMKRLEEGKT